MKKPEVCRRDEYGDRETVIHSYAPGDGDLSFVACNVRTKKATTPGPTREECERALPDGWELYPDGPYFRARRILQEIVGYRCAECGKTGPEHGYWDATDPGTHKFVCGEAIYAPVKRP